MKWRRAIVTPVFLLAVFAMGQASALSTDQRNALTDGGGYFNVDASCSVSIGSTTLMGGDIPTQVWNYFKQKGLSDIADAGIMGNISQESSFNPTNTDGVAHGLAQWQDARFTALQDFAQKQGKSWTDVGVQLDYLWKEISPGGGREKTLPDLKKSTDLTSLTVGVGSPYTFEIDFEGASDPQMDNRIRDAKSALTKYGGGDVTASGVTTDASTGTGSCDSAGSTTSAYSGKGFPLYSQCDPAWAKHPYWGDDICGAGCGPTSMAMIVTALTGQKVTPDTIADFYTAKGDEGSWGGAELVAAKYGLQSKILGADAAKVSAAVQSGSLVIMAGQGSLPFTSAGHFVIVRAVTSDGKWILGDPDTAAGHSNTKAWDPAAVIAGVNADGAASGVVAISK